MATQPALDTTNHAGPEGAIFLSRIHDRYFLEKAAHRPVAGMPNFGAWSEFLMSSGGLAPIAQLISNAGANFELNPDAKITTLTGIMEGELGQFAFAAKLRSGNDGLIAQRIGVSIPVSGSRVGFMHTRSSGPLRAESIVSDAPERPADLLNLSWDIHAGRNPLMYPPVRQEIDVALGSIISLVEVEQAD